MLNDARIVDVVIKKDFFVKSRKDNIKDQFDFISVVNQLIQVLGKGAYGTVYKAQTKEYPHTIRAIKVIKKKNVKNQQALIDEVTILRECDHPSIVKMYETYEDDQYLCMVLEQSYCFIERSFCEGGELFQRLQKHGSFSEKNAKDIFTQMVKIVKYLHYNKICHRDLKPENFLMFNQETLDLKLTDFGLSTKWATDLRKQLKETGRNKILGTSYYIAPEVLDKDYNETCDVWSLGVLLYILVSACPPFDGKDDAQILRSVQKLSYNLDSTYVYNKVPEMKNVSPELKDLIRKILVPAQQRISIDGILKHPWMTGKSNQVPLKLDFSKMRQFAQFSRVFYLLKQFKTVVMAYIASQLPEKQIHALGNAFRQVDQNSDGYLTIEELRQVIERQHENLSYMELKDLMQSIDTDKNGKINYNEFLACCLENSYLNNEKYLKHIFNYFDTNKDGCISCEEFRSIIKSCGIQQYKDKTVQQIIADVDLNKDGKIDYEEFLQSMTKC